MRHKRHPVSRMNNTIIDKDCVRGRKAGECQENSDRGREGWRLRRQLLSQLHNKKETGSEREDESEDVRKGCQGDQEPGMKAAASRERE